MHNFFMYYALRFTMILFSSKEKHDVLELDIFSVNNSYKYIFLMNSTQHQNVQTFWNNVKVLMLAKIFI